MWTSLLSPIASGDGLYTILKQHQKCICAGFSINSDSPAKNCSPPSLTRVGFFPLLPQLGCLQLLITASGLSFIRLSQSFRPPASRSTLIHPLHTTLAPSAHSTRSSFPRSISTRLICLPIQQTPVTAPVRSSPGLRT